MSSEVAVGVVTDTVSLLREKRRSRRLELAGAVLVGCTLFVAVTGPALAARRSPDAANRYRVRAGDTLSGIAERTGVSVRALALANGIRNVNLVFVGQSLRLPTAAAAPPPAEPPRASGARSTAVSVSGRRHPTALTGSRLRLMPVFEHWAAHYGMRSDLLKAICYLESGWHTQVVSSTGAVGIGQLMPATATFVRQLTGLPLTRWSASDNIHMSAKYLRWLLDHTGWNVRRAVASYYQGLGALQAHGMYADTKAYVRNVLALQTRF